MTQGQSSGYILVKLVDTTGGRAAQAAEDALELPGVQRGELVTGPFDLILHVAAAGELAGLDLLGRVRGPFRGDQGAPLLGVGRGGPGATAVSLRHPPRMSRHLA